MKNKALARMRKVFTAVPAFLFFFLFAAFQPPGVRAASRGPAVPPAPASDPAPPLVRFEAALRRFQSARSLPARAAALNRMEKLRPWLPDPRRALAAWRQLAATGQPPLIEAELDNQIAREQQRLGEPAAAAALWRKLGLLRHWQMVGPFDNSTPDAIAQAVGPERGINLAAHYPGKSGSVGWRRLEWPAALGRIRLGRYFSPREAVSAYLATWIYSPRARQVALRLSDSGSTRLWVNGELLFSEAMIHPGDGFDMHVIPARLAAGWNQVLVKDGELESEVWIFALRATTPNGRPLALHSSARPHPAPDWAAQPAPQFAVADLTAIARAAATTAAGWQHYAWILYQKANFNRGSNTLNYALEQAEALAAPNGAIPTASAPAALRWRRIELDFAEMDTNQGRAYRTLRRVLENGPGPGYAEALARRGEIELSRSEFWPARRDFIAALKARWGGAASLASASPQQWLAAPHAALGLLETYAGMGLAPQALALERRLRAVGAAAINGLAVPVAQTLLHLGLHADAQAWTEAAFPNNRKNPALFHQLAYEQLHNGHSRAAARTLQTVLAEDPTSRVQWMLAEILGGQGNFAAARRALAAALRLQPNGHKLWRRQGELEYAAGQPTAAIRAWQTALRLDPQNSTLASRLHLLQGGHREASFYRPYRIAAAAAIAALRRHPHPALLVGPIGLVANTTVIRIFPSGNVGRYVQQIFRVNNRVGAEALASYSVTYDPRRQEVHYLAARVYHPDGSTTDAPAPGDSLVSQSVGYETYYNVRNRYVVMPSLRPGDYVQIAYRMMPTTLESLYGNYFGELQPFQTSAPTLRQQLVVLSPASLPLYSDAVRFTGQANVETRDGMKIYRWQLRNQPGYTSEPNGPPSIEQIPYVIVSAFGNWTAFAHWYQGLIRDTFVMDGDLQRATDRLVRGLPNDQAKVKAIYSYVIRNTHYVALEFGIHGYRPYPVSEVFRRRFGDCKDKASLLIAMLARAGIAADIVLVRTRDLGHVSTRIPAIGDFDHAIVYVPELGWYLDGTAEYNGARELPELDQHALVFRIPVGGDLRADGLDPQSSPAARAIPLQPVITPVLPAAMNSMVRTITGSVNSKGRLQFRAQVTVVGQSAPYYRHAMQIVGRQAGVMQAMLRQDLPGLTVTRARALNPNHYDRPLTIVFHARAPRFAAPQPNGGLRLPRQFEPLIWVPRMAPLATRHTPVHVGSPQLIVESVDLQLPPGYTLTPPAALHLHTPFANFDYTTQLTNGRLQWNMRLETLKSVIPVAEYATFRRFWVEVDAKLDAGIYAHPQSASLRPGPAAMAFLENLPQVFDRQRSR